MECIRVGGMARRVLCFGFLWVMALHAKAQICHTTLPLSVTEAIPALSSFVEMESFDTEEFIQEATRKVGTKNIAFAKRIDVKLNPSNAGEWIETSSGNVWRVGIRSAGAYSLYITFNSFYLSDGAKLFVYSPGYIQFRGAFTSENNGPLGVLSVAPIAGDEIIIELNIPDGRVGYGDLNISKVYHDCLNVFKGKDSVVRRYKGNCEENVNCTNGKYWQTEKRSVCKVITDGALCTGTLLGNTAGSSEAYLITAHHTIFDEAHAAEAVFHFNFERTSCGGAQIEGHFLSGATLVATTDSKLDFALLRLHDIPPVFYQPYYAGWDVSGKGPERGVSIHHPWGNPKQIAIEYHPLSTGTFGGNYDPLTSWVVARWEIGNTEPGSSGAPLFDQKHRVVGTLTGGSSQCENPVNDYFNKLSLAWDRYPTPENQLKAWLDPGNKGMTALDGYDPHGFNVDHCDTTWNISNQSSLMLSTKGFSAGYVSGHNDGMFTQFAEKFISPSSILLPGVFMNVAKAYHGQPLSYIMVKVWEGNAIPDDEKYSKMIFIKDLGENAINYIGFDSVITVSGNFFVGYEINYGHPADTFAVYHSVNALHSTMYGYNGHWQNMAATSSYSVRASMAIGLVECYGNVRKPEKHVFSVYPNPSRGSFYVDIPSGMILYSAECFDTMGRRVPGAIVYSEEKDRLDFQLPTGTYILKVVTKENQFLTKVVIVN